MSINLVNCGDEPHQIQERGVVDINEERARWATESANAARGLSRLADLTLLLDLHQEGVEVGELNDLAGRLHSWAQLVAHDLGRPELADDLARRQQAFTDWRKLEAEVRSGSPERARTRRYRGLL